MMNVVSRAHQIEIWETASKNWRQTYQNIQSIKIKHQQPDLTINIANILRGFYNL